jgi:hypothetical protein
LTNRIISGIVDGDCGSLVVSQETLEVFGHVIASNPLGEAYVVPLSNTFCQISNALGSNEISLPSPKLLMANLVTHYSNTDETDVVDKAKIIAASMEEQNLDAEPPPLLTVGGKLLKETEVAVPDDLRAYEPTKQLPESSATIDAQTEDCEERSLYLAVENDDNTFDQLSLESTVERLDITRSRNCGMGSGGSFTPQKETQRSPRHFSAQNLSIETYDPTEASKLRDTSGKQDQTSILESSQSSAKTLPSGFTLPEEEYGMQWARYLRLEFQKLLREHSLQELEKSRSRTDSLSPQELASSSSGPPPSYEQATSSKGLLRKFAKVPLPPADVKSDKFRSLLFSLSSKPMKYEDSGALDEALRVIPLDRIYSEAAEEYEGLKSQAESMGDGRNPEWGYDDCVIRALLRYLTLDVFGEFILTWT